MKILASALILFAAVQPRCAEPAAPVPVSSALIRQWSEEMRTNHPALKAVAARVRAARFERDAVRTWEDPRLGFGGAVSSARGVRLSEDGNLIYSLEQPLPLFGKAHAIRRVAAADMEAEGARLGARFQVLRRDLARALFHVALADQIADLSAQDLAWMRTMVLAARERYGVGKATQAEVLRLENELSKRADQLQTDRREREHGSFAVNRLLNRELHAPIPRLALPPPGGLLVYTEALAEHALQFEPKLRVLQLEAERARAVVVATRKTRLPGVSAGIEGRQYSGDGEFREGTFSVSPPCPG